MTNEAGELACVKDLNWRSGADEWRWLEQWATTGSYMSYTWGDGRRGSAFQGGYRVLQCYIA